MLENWTKEQQSAINEYLTACIKNNYKCAHCMLRHDDGTCFFAYDCFLNDKKYYREDE